MYPLPGERERNSCDKTRRRSPSRRCKLSSLGYVGRALRTRLHSRGHQSVRDINHLATSANTAERNTAAQCTDLTFGEHGVGRGNAPISVPRRRPTRTLGCLDSQQRPRLCPSRTRCTASYRTQHAPAFARNLLRLSIHPVRIKEPWWLSEVKHPVRSCRIR